MVQSTAIKLDTTKALGIDPGLNNWLTGLFKNPRPGAGWGVSTHIQNLKSKILQTILDLRFKILDRPEGTGRLAVGLTLLKNYSFIANYLLLIISPPIRNLKSKIRQRFTV